MKVRLSAGAEIDTLTRDELDGSLRQHADQWLMEVARGVKHIDLPVLQGVIAGGAVQLGGLENPEGQAQTGAQVCGPRSGWYWRIERVSIAGITMSDTGSLALYKTNISGRRFVGYIPTLTCAYHPGGSALVLRPDDNLILVGSGLTTAAGTTVYLTGEADECAAEQIYKLIV